ncbi:MAG TPA: HNH endonuclease [Allosphingosinicella sp.]|jgi:hypothetical protein
MPHWIDFALIGDEAALDTAIRGLTQDVRNQALFELAGALGLSDDEVLNGVLRLLVERARPLALPARLWSRPVTASDDPLAYIKEHFARRGISPSKKRLDAALALYLQFSEERAGPQVRLRDLQQCDFRCQHCGLAFCNEELEHKGIESPFGYRGRDKRDPMKPHWNDKLELRFPTFDHVWPISLYGNNDAANLRVLCRGCNLGKEDVVAFEQTKPSVGLPGRGPLLQGGPVSWPAFYAQLRRFPECSRTGKGCSETELTVILKDPAEAFVLDNLLTVASPGF